MSFSRKSYTIRKIVMLITVVLFVSLIMISETDGFHFSATKRSLVFEKRIKQIQNVRKISPLASSSEFKSNSDGSRKMPKISLEGKLPEIGKSVSVGSIQQGGYFCSFEMYACQKQTQRLVGSHLANWARAEIYCLRDCGTFSMILHSICGRRVVHVVGWKIEGNLLARNFEDMKKRGEGTEKNTLLIIKNTTTFQLFFLLQKTEYYV